MRSFSVFALILVGCASSPVAYQKVPSLNEIGESRAQQRLAREAATASDNAKALGHMQRAAALRPDHAGLLLSLAAAEARSGEFDSAVVHLGRIAELGFAFDIEDEPQFASLRAVTGYQEVLDTFSQNRAPTLLSTPAFTIPPAGVIHEGLAYDATSMSFYVGSVKDRNIVRMNASRTLSPFSTTPLPSVLGMEVDSKRGHLVAAVTFLDETPKASKESMGSAGVAVLDLTTGSVVREVMMASVPTKHAFGDVTVRSDGTIFVTDSLSPALYALDPGASAFRIVVAGEPFVSPQGMALSKDERFLYVADYSRGIVRVELGGAKANVVIPSTAKTSLLGIDGLDRAGSNLIAIQNGTSPQRVVLLKLSRDGAGVLDAVVLEKNHPLFDEPTLGVVVADDYYFIANAAWESVAAAKDEAAIAKLRPTSVMRVPLRGHERP